MERICIGVVTKPQALKGEFRVKPQLLNLNQYKNFEKVYIGSFEYNVEKVTLRDTFVILKVSNINSCEEAELLRNKEIFADMEIEGSDEDNSLYVGYILKILDENIGKISDVNNYGSKDIVSFVGERNGMMPIIDGLFENIDNDNKIITLNKEIFDQIVAYED